MNLTIGNVVLVTLESFRPQQGLTIMNALRYAGFKNPKVKKTFPSPTGVTYHEFIRGN